MRVSDRGGRPTALTTLDQARGEYSHRWPDALPGGRWILFTVGIEDASFDDGRIDAVSLETGERRTVMQNAGFARYLPNGRLLFVRGGRLSSVPFDPDRLTVRGAPEVLVDGVRYDPRNGGCHLAVSRVGRVHLRARRFPTPRTTTSRGSIATVRIQRVVDTPRPFRDPRVESRWTTGRDHDRPHAGFRSVDGGCERDALAALVQSVTVSSDLDPDGARIIVGAQNTAAQKADAGKPAPWRLLAFAADGTGSPAVLFEGPNRVYPNAWTPDGRQSRLPGSAARRRAGI